MNGENHSRLVDVAMRRLAFLKQSLVHSNQFGGGTVFVPELYNRRNRLLAGMLMIKSRILFRVFESNGLGIIN